MAVQSNTPPPAATAARAKGVKECFLEADRFIKEKKFDKAREEVEKAQKIDPRNPYLEAYVERIKHFEQVHSKFDAFVEEKKREVVEHPPAAAPAAAQAAAPAAVPPPPPTTPPTFSTPSPPVQPSAPVVAPNIQRELEAMRQQIMSLSNDLQQERKVREEIQHQQVQALVGQFRTALEKAWRYGAPKEKELTDLRQLAKSLKISDDVVASTTREVKLEMYSRAAKEVVEKGRLLKSSSSTLDWLRKVYQVSVTEYLEYESQFLIDLVSDRFRGTLMFVTSDEDCRTSLLPRLKSSGYAVVQSENPETALEKIERVTPTVILCDSAFPKGSLSGLRFLQLIRANGKYQFLPFVLICRPDETEQMQSSELRPNECYIPKPVDFEELSTLIDVRLVQLREYLTSLT